MPVKIALARLFKTNDVVSLHFVKISKVKISNICQYFLLKKCEKLLHCAKASLSFSAKNFSVFGYKVVKYLTSYQMIRLLKHRDHDA